MPAARGPQLSMGDIHAATEGRSGGEGDNEENRDNEKTIEGPWTYQSLNVIKSAQFREN